MCSLGISICISYFFYFFYCFYFFFFIFCFFFLFLFFSKKNEKWSSNSYTDVSFKLAKYQHLELILRENKLTYTKLISNEADSGTKIESERSKEKSQIPQKSGRHYSGLCMLHQYYSSSLPIRDYLLYESCGTGGKPSTWFPPGGLVEQNFRSKKFHSDAYWL